MNNHSNIIVYDSQRAPSIGVVQRALMFKGLNYTVGGPQKPTFQNSVISNITKQVPMMSVDDRYFYDLFSIINYLEEQIPQPSFWSGNTDQKASQWLLLDWCDHSMFWHILALRWVPEANARASYKQVSGVVPAPIRPFLYYYVRRNNLGELRAQGLGLLSEAQLLDSMQQKLNWLDGLLSNLDYFYSDQLGIADIYVACFMDYGLAGTIPELSGMVESHENLARLIMRVDEMVGSPVWPEDQARGLDIPLPLNGR